MAAKFHRETNSGILTSHFRRREQVRADPPVVVRRVERILSAHVNPAIYSPPLPERGFWGFHRATFSSEYMRCECRFPRRGERLRMMRVEFSPGRPGERKHRGIIGVSPGLINLIAENRPSVMCTRRLQTVRRNHLSLFVVS